MNDIIGEILSMAGVTLTVPAFIVFMSTGRKRLLRFGADVEQRMIDFWPWLFGAYVVGDVMIAAYWLREISLIWSASFAAALTFGAVAMFFNFRWAQDDLDRRQADSAGMFWCRWCLEVHHIDAECKDERAVKEPA